MNSALATNLAGIALRNPVILAAGCAGVLDEMSDVLDLSKVGAATTKSITREAREGNATWRIIEAGDAGMLNAIGLANPGLDAFLEHYAPRAAALACPVIASAAGFSIDDYVAIAGNLDEWADRNIVAVELNVSCPNVKTGTEFGMSAPLLGELVRAVRAVAKRTKLFVKLSPITPEITLVARAAIVAGADALTLTNTIPAMAIDVERRVPRLANSTGGLSGPALHPIVTRLIHEVYTKVCRETRTPIIGLGGVLRWEHAAEFVVAGATCVGMGTGLFVNPRSPLGVVRGLEKWVQRQGRGGVPELVGAMEA